MRILMIACMVTMILLFGGCGRNNPAGSSDNPGNKAPVITSQPLNQSVIVGATASFSVSATGTGLVYQWWKDSADIDSATSSGYTTPLTTMADSGATFWCVVSNADGTVSSDSAMLFVNAPGTITDMDGNVYTEVIIGAQTWMVENLKTTKYNDGTSIPLVTGNTAWGNLTTPAYCWYDNDVAANKNTYGTLYNWYAVNTGKLAPIGWHVASDAEWNTLITDLGGIDSAGGKLKETDTTHWVSPNMGATNETGFSALPGGYRIFNGTYDYLGYGGYWWSATPINVTESWVRSMYNGNTRVFTSGKYNNYGYSVRCVRD
jgi:uncharacterized protein (TIGR02145 family)